MKEDFYMKLIDAGKLAKELATKMHACDKFSDEWMAYYSAIHTVHAQPKVCDEEPAMTLFDLLDKMSDLTSTVRIHYGESYDHVLKMRAYECLTTLNRKLLNAAIETFDLLEANTIDVYLAVEL